MCTVVISNFPRLAWAKQHMSILYGLLFGCFSLGELGEQGPGRWNPQGCPGVWELWQAGQGGASQAHASHAESVHQGGQDFAQRKYYQDDLVLDGTWCPYQYLQICIQTKPPWGRAWMEVISPLKGGLTTTYSGAASRPELCFGKIWRKGLAVLERPSRKLLLPFG